MSVIETAIPTAEASRYLQQLCKHWSHKLDVTFTPTQGRVAFSGDAVCSMEADADMLRLRVEAQSAEEAARFGEVVVRHLERFAFRAPLVIPAWSDA